eukprot:gi/632937997/ref/XP_007901897.1/ PREDICTED: mitochondrial assembly of ribosomal large subunit protein 1 [Callorhinchus milii]
MAAWLRTLAAALPRPGAARAPARAPAPPGSSPTQATGSIYKSVFTIDYLVALLRQENAKDICVIKVPEEIKYTDYFIIVSGTSARHLHAMAHYALKVYKQLKTEQLPQVNMEGKDTEDWKCIDFGNIVIHFMLPETREVYELEKLWTLRSHDDQLAKIPQEMFPSDFIYEPTDVGQKEQSLPRAVLGESTREADSNSRTLF